MAINLVATRLNAFSAAINTSVLLTMTAPEAVAIGSTLMLHVAADNSGASGVAPAFAISDPAGNVWTRRATALADPGLAAEGVYIETWTARVTATYLPGAFLTFTAAPSTGRGCFVIQEWSGVAASPIAVAAVTGSGLGTTATAPAVAASAAGQRVVGLAGIETNVAVTGDADTTNGAWSALTTPVSDSTVAATSIRMATQHKSVTAPGAQNWAVTWAGAADWAAAALILAVAPPLGVVPVFDVATARVRLTVSGFHAATSYAVVQRFDTVTLTNAKTVRGGGRVTVDPVSTTSFVLDDYEFTPGVLNTYRVRIYSAAGVLLESVDATVTPALPVIWLKSPTRPFLNRPVVVTDFGSSTTPARAGVFEVLGRRLPVALTEVRGSGRYELTITTQTLDEARAVDLFLSFGDVIYLQVPAGCVVPGNLYAAVGDVTKTRRGRHDTQRRYFSLPLIEVAAPDASIAGVTITWAGVISAYAMWADVIAAKATWLDLMTTISAPADEIVG